jgi:hypothetical protein
VALESCPNQWCACDTFLFLTTSTAVGTSEGPPCPSLLISGTMGTGRGRPAPGRTPASVTSREPPLRGRRGPGSGLMTGSGPDASDAMAPVCRLGE